MGLTFLAVSKKKAQFTVAAYCRVSSRHQRNDSQRAEIARWLTANNINPKSVQWFEDVETGTTLHRPAFESLQQTVFAGNVRTVILWKLDRLSRRQRGRHQHPGRLGRTRRPRCVGDATNRSRRPGRPNGCGVDVRPCGNRARVSTRTATGGNPHRQSTGSLPR